MNDGNVKWGKLQNTKKQKKIKKIPSSTTVHHNKPVCKIIDDSTFARYTLTKKENTPDVRTDLRV